MQYDLKHRKNTTRPYDKPVMDPESDPAIPNSMRSRIDAIRNVDIHAGSSLHLEDSLKSRIEHSIGFKMDNVELRESHDAEAMGAKAFAKGNVVHFAPGQYHPETEQGRELITHELTHVAQQAQGGVCANVAGLNVNASEHLESAADHGSLGESYSSPAPLPAMNAETAPLQGKFGLRSIWDYFRSLTGSAEQDHNNEPAPQAEIEPQAEPEVIPAAQPSSADTVKIEGANNTNADLRTMPNSGSLQEKLGENSGKYKSYGKMLAAIDQLNSVVRTAKEESDVIPTGTVKKTLMEQYQAAIHAMDDYLEEMSGFAFSSSGRTKRQARREYVSALRDMAMSDLNRLVNLKGDSDPAAAVADARTTELNDSDFTGTIMGGAMNQVYKFNQGFFKPSKGADTELNSNETSYADSIGVKYMDESGNRIDPRMNQREVATSRLDRLLGGGVICKSQMARLSSDSALQGNTYGKRTFNVGAGKEGVLMEAAKGQGFKKYNWDVLSLDKSKKSALVNDYEEGKTIGERMESQGLEFSRARVQGVDSEASKNARNIVYNKEGEGITLNAQDPKLQRDMNALFLLDTLAMQTDRHAENFFIDADENGNYKGLTGIDNDMSFGVNNDQFGTENTNYGGLPEQMLVDKKMAEKIKGVKKPELEMMFSDLLSKEEIDALWERFQKLSEYLNNLDPNNLVDEWNDETAERQLKMSKGVMAHKGMDYYTRHLLNINFGYSALKNMH